MMPTHATHLHRECEVFCRYLFGRAPGDYILEKYCQAHERSSEYFSAGAFAHALLSVASRGPAFARLADSYACLFARYSAFRRKLILLFSILESASVRHGFSEDVDGSAQPVLFAKIVFRGVLFALRLALACLLFLPMRLALGASQAATEKGH